MSHYSSDCLHYGDFVAIDEDAAADFAIGTNHVFIVSAAWSLPVQQPPRHSVRATGVARLCVGLRVSSHPRQPLWRLVKEGHVAEARVRPIDGIGVELRYEWNGELRVSQMFKSWEELEAAAAEKRRDLEARGWQSR
jgi:hypothetical protein